MPQTHVTLLVEMIDGSVYALDGGGRRLATALILALDDLEEAWGERPDPSTIRSLTFTVHHT